MLIDQHMHSPDAIYVDFFERPAATTSMLAALALRTGAPVVPVFALPLPGGRYRTGLRARRSIRPTPDTPDAVREFTQRCTDVLEMYVRRHPSLWLWMHRRWRDAPLPASTPGMFPPARAERARRSDGVDSALAHRRARAELAGRPRDGAAGHRRRPRAACPARTLAVAARSPASRRCSTRSPASTRSCRSTRPADGAACSPRRQTRAAGGRPVRRGAAPPELLSLRRCSRGGRASASAGGIARDLRAPAAHAGGRRRRTAARCTRRSTTSTSRAALGIAAGPRRRRSLRVGRRAPRSRGGRCCASAGWRGEPIVGLAPGAAYGIGQALAARARGRAGGAPRPRPWARARHGRRRGRPATARSWIVVAPRARAGLGAGAMIDLTGRTDLPTLVGVLAAARRSCRTTPAPCTWRRPSTCRSSAIFGPTREWATSPLPGPRGRAARDRPHATSGAGRACCARAPSTTGA